MTSMANQAEEVGKAAAQMVHYAMAWNEALDGDAVQDVVRVFDKELSSLNGETQALPDEAKLDIATNLLTDRAYDQYIEEVTADEEKRTGRSIAMAICECGVEMKSGGSCKFTHVGNAKRQWRRFNATEDCGDCAVKAGGTHHINCDQEECPKCGMQFLACDCKGFTAWYRKGDLPKGVKAIELNEDTDMSDLHDTIKDALGE